MISAQFSSNSNPALAFARKEITIAFQRDEDNSPKRSPFAREIAGNISRILTVPVDMVRDYLKRFRYLGPLRQMPAREHAAPRSPDASRWPSGLGAWDELQTGIPN